MSWAGPKAFALPMFYCTSFFWKLRLICQCPLVEKPKPNS